MRRISGNRTAEDIAREYYTRLNSKPVTEADSQPITPSPISQPIGSIVNGFYVFDKKQLLDATSDKSRKFYKESGYADLDNCSRLEVSKGVFKDSSGNYVVNINQPDGRNLIQNQGGKLLTTQLMYNLFIPYIKAEAAKGNAEAIATLKEMTDTKAEWLEDIIVNESSGILRQKTRKIKIASKTEAMSFIDNKDGYFDRTDMNKFGYPKNVKTSGELSYWYPRGDERAAVRDWNSGLDLNLSRGPSGANDGLGVRFAKFF